MAGRPLIALLLIASIALAEGAPPIHLPFRENSVVIAAEGDGSLMVTFPEAPTFEPTLCSSAPTEFRFVLPYAANHATAVLLPGRRGVASVRADGEVLIAPSTSFTIVPRESPLQVLLQPCPPVVVRSATRRGDSPEPATPIVTGPTIQQFLFTPAGLELQLTQRPEKIELLSQGTKHRLSLASFTLADERLLLPRYPTIDGTPFLHATLSPDSAGAVLEVTTTSEMPLEAIPQNTTIVLRPRQTR